MKVYDGELRADLGLKLSENAPADRGYEGEAVVCDVRFVPVAGYRRDANQSNT